MVANFIIKSVKQLNDPSMCFVIQTHLKKRLKYYDTPGTTYCTMIHHNENVKITWPLFLHVPLLKLFIYRKAWLGRMSYFYCIIRYVTCSIIKFKHNRTVDIISIPLTLLLIKLTLIIESQLKNSLNDFNYYYSLRLLQRKINIFLISEE